MRKLRVTSGLLQENSFIVITLNQESNSACREKNHFPFRWIVLYWTKSSGETHRNIGKRKTKYACIVDADESTRPRLERAGHITAKGMKSMTHKSLVHKFIPMPQASKTPDVTAAVEKEWGKKTGVNSSLVANEGQKQERSDRRSKE